MKTFRKGSFSQARITQWLIDLRPNPSAPESGFHVTAVFRARLGKDEDYYFGGVNVENHDHRLTTHGEEGGIAGILTGLGKGGEIVEGWVMGAPGGVTPGDGSHFTSAFISCCGKCRQQIAGIADGNAKIHSVSLDGAVQTTTVKKFLPDLFSFRQFIPEAAGAKSAGTSLSAAEVEKRLIRKAPLPEQEIRSWLTGFESIDYVSKVSQSAIIRLDNAAYVAGVKMEEAAFQSMNAAQSAMAIATSEFGERKVEEVWVYTKGRDEKALPPNAYGTLPMSALQTLFQFAANDRIPVHYLNDGPDKMTVELVEAAKVAPTSRNPFYLKK